MIEARQKKKWAEFTMAQLLHLHQIMWESDNILYEANILILINLF